MAATLTARLARGADNLAGLQTIDGLTELSLRGVDGPYVPTDNRGPTTSARDITFAYTPPGAPQDSLFDWLDLLNERFTIEITYKAVGAPVVNVFPSMTLKDALLRQSGSNVSTWQLLFRLESSAAA